MAMVVEEISDSRPTNLKFKISCTMRIRTCNKRMSHTKNPIVRNIKHVRKILVIPTKNSQVTERI